MKRLTYLAGALVLATGPVLADQVTTGVMLMRDSDGIVISVIHPVDYGTYPPVFSTGGGVVYMMDGHVLEFSGGPEVMVTDRGDAGPGLTGGVGPTAVVAGTTYLVEVKGGVLWLIDPATGLRHATERVAGLQESWRVAGQSDRLWVGLTSL